MASNEARQMKMPIFAERFNELRGERTQADFAEFLGISRPTVGFYENGERIPDAFILKQIAEKCGVTTDYLVGLRDNKTYEDANIGELTGLSDAAIEVLKMAANDKKFLIKKNDTHTIYWADALSLLIENINYFPDIAVDLVGALNFSAELKFILNTKNYLDNPDALVRFAEEITAVGDKYQRTGAFLTGEAYKKYLLNQLSDSFNELLSLILLRVVPEERLDKSAKLQIDCYSLDYSINSKLEYKMKNWDELHNVEGAKDADDSETR